MENEEELLQQLAVYLDEKGDERLQQHLGACREGGSGFCSKNSCALFMDFVNQVEVLAPQLDQYTTKSHGGCDFRLGERRVTSTEGKNILGVRFDANGLKIRFMGTHASPEFPRGTGKQHVVTDEPSLKIIIDRLKMNKYSYVKWAEEYCPSGRRPSNY